MSRFVPVLAAVAWVACSAAASGCVVRRPAPYVTYTTTVPPAPMVEVVPEAAPGAVWVNGYWYWNGFEYVWVRGHWATAPGGNYVWVDSGWVVVDGRYRFVPGRWSVRGRAPSVRYVHPHPQVRVRPGGGGYRAMPRARAPGPVRAQPPRGNARVRVR